MVQKVHINYTEYSLGKKLKNGAVKRYVWVELILQKGYQVQQYSHKLLFTFTERNGKMIYYLLSSLLVY